MNQPGAETALDSSIILTGPTAVGKTELSLTLAERIGGEIISADSRQIYKELTIGTAKPSASELQRVPHHLIDELPLTEPFTAGRFEHEAKIRMDDILSRGRLPLVVGGSTLYIHALKYGLADIPDIPESVRISLEAEIGETGPGPLFEELQEVDPVSAATMDASKTQRLTRALEVYRATGKPLSAYHDEQAPPSHRFRTFVLSMERKRLYERINQRVDAMFSRGLLDEVRDILDKGYDPDLNPLRTIGYQEPIRHLRGEISYDEMVRLVKRNSRRYAKRQLTWFRRDEENEWIDASTPTRNLIARILCPPDQRHGSST